MNFTLIKAVFVEFIMLVFFYLNHLMKIVFMSLLLIVVSDSEQIESVNMHQHSHNCLWLVCLRITDHNFSEILHEKMIFYSAAKMWKCHKHQIPSGTKATFIQDLLQIQKSSAFSSLVILVSGSESNVKWNDMS